MAEMRRRRAWETYWRKQLQFDLWGVAAATAEVDNLDRSVPSALSISFQEARAFVATNYGLTCHCHGPANGSDRRTGIPVRAEAGTRKAS